MRLEPNISKITGDRDSVPRNTNRKWGPWEIQW